MEVACDVVVSVGEKSSAQCGEVVGVEDMDGGIGWWEYPCAGGLIALADEP